MCVSSSSLKIEKLTSVQTPFALLISNVFLGPICSTRIFAIRSPNPMPIFNSMKKKQVKSKQKIIKKKKQKKNLALPPLHSSRFEFISGSRASPSCQSRRAGREPTAVT